MDLTLNGQLHRVLFGPDQTDQQQLMSDLPGQDHDDLKLSAPT